LELDGFARKLHWSVQNSFSPRTARILRVAR
jgi:hypothetical protein